MSLPDIFLDAPFAHRGLHDRDAGVIENSWTAFQRAIDAGYGIELDLQLSKDHHAMVFHDYEMRRLTGQSGPIQTRNSDELKQTTLTDSADVIHDFPDILNMVDGRVPLLIEIKDQDGHMGPNIGPLERATAKALKSYSGPVAVMSFNPHSVAALATHLPDVPRGLVTSSYDPGDWPIPEETCNRLRTIPDYGPLGASFISHEAGDLGRPRVAELKGNGATILCWTIRDQPQADKALEVAQNITFEGFVPA